MQNIVLQLKYAVLHRKKQKEYFPMFKNDNISRYHAKLIIDNGKFILYDLYSANGTFVNGKRILPENGASISFGDEIALADINFRLCLK